MLKWFVGLVVRLVIALSGGVEVFSRWKGRPEAMGSMDAEVEIDMEISDDEQESSKARVRAGPVVDGRGQKRTVSGEPELTGSILILLILCIEAHVLVFWCLRTHVHEVCGKESCRWF